MEGASQGRRHIKLVSGEWRALNGLAGLLPLALEAARS